MFAKQSNSKDFLKVFVFLITDKKLEEEDLELFALKFLNTLHRGKFVVQVPLLHCDNQFTSTNQDLLCFCIKNFKE